MPRGVATTFIPKRAHKKSRAGCQTCKRKKVKCSEVRPACSYCALRKLTCIYPASSDASADDSPLSGIYDSSEIAEDVSDFNIIAVSPALQPLTITSTGTLSTSELELMHFYSTRTWASLTVRKEKVTENIVQTILPRLGFSHSYLLNALLGITAAHIHHLNPSPRSEILTTLYRQKTLEAYNASLSNVNEDNYEAILVTSLLLQALVPSLDRNSHEKAASASSSIWNHLSTTLSLFQGLQIIASMKWASGAETLSVFPLLQRELLPLTPSPSITSTPSSSSTSATSSIPPPESPSATPNIPDLPHSLSILPPSLLPLYTYSASQPDYSSTFQQPLTALTALFLSLHLHGFSPDLFTRAIVFPTYLPPSFIHLVNAKEPRALVVLMWYFAFVRCIPGMWWMEGANEIVVRGVWEELGEWRECARGAWGIVGKLGGGARDEELVGEFFGWGNGGEG